MTFDVVGTLIDFEAGVLTSVRSLGGDKAKDLRDLEILHPFRDAHSHHRGRFLDTMPDVYLYVAQVLGLPPDRRAALEFQRQALEFPAFPDSVDALKRLRKHYRLVAMTNVDRVSLSAYSHTLGNPFDDTCTCDDTGTEKPDPAYFSYNRGRQSAFGYKFSDILHTAQSQYHDIGIAMALGYPTCWIERRRGLDGFGASPVPDVVTTPTWCFATLKELADAVDAEFAPA
jgi:putative hydrolase of the HAD superfamily